MVVDARDLESKEICMRLRDIFSVRCEEEISVEVMLRSRSAAKKVNAFASMSGCRTCLEEKNGCFVMRITGSFCGCG